MTALLPKMHHFFLSTKRSPHYNCFGAGETISMYVIQHAFSIAKHILNSILSQVTMAEADVDNCTGNKEPFFHSQSGAQQVGVP